MISVPRHPNRPQPALLPSMDEEMKDSFIPCCIEHLHSLLQPSPVPTLLCFNYS